MLKSFNIIESMSKKLADGIKKQLINNYYLHLSLHQKLYVYIVSDEIKSCEQLISFLDFDTEVLKYNIEFEFLDCDTAKSDEYNFLFSEDEEKINYGVRRSLQNLLEPNHLSEKHTTPVVTFYSYKGGVGRSTALAMFSSYYASSGKKVFVIDCDFEAPGLTNFFNISQFEKPKSGVVEFLNDKKFIKNLDLSEEYIYEVPSQFCGSGNIYMMPAGNVFSEKQHYLEGLARIDFQGEDSLYHELCDLIKEIERIYSPDLILFDSRTGFNNIFGTLFELSDTIVGLFGDDKQNDPGLNYLLEKASDINSPQLCLIFSIVSTSISKRYQNFKENILIQRDTNGIEKEIPCFYFKHIPDLELVGTVLEDYNEIALQMSQDVLSYGSFFSFIKKTVDGLERLSNKHENSASTITTEIKNNSENLLYSVETLSEAVSSLYEDENKVLEKLLDNFPQQYAENEKLTEDFFNNKFFIRDCMKDFFISDYTLLIGGKGTGKTAFYKALQNLDFFELLVQRAEKSHLNFKIQHIISEMTDINKTGFIGLSSNFEPEDKASETFVRKFWITYIWLSLQKSENIVKSDNYFEVKNNESTARNIKKIIEDNTLYNKVEEELNLLDDSLLKNDERLLLTFDQLDYVVLPNEWGKGISPLIRLSLSHSWKRIELKLFLRRDLFDKLDNITNKNALDNQSVNLEWSQKEMFAFLFKVIFAYSKNEFERILKKKMIASFVDTEIIKKITKPGQYNQVPLHDYILRPLATAFFGNENKVNWQDAYDLLYNNLRNANRTVSLRPFLDLIRLSIDVQKNDNGQYRNGAVLGLSYCNHRSVRSEAVDNYFKDLANEAGNDIIKFFVSDIRSNSVSENLKYSSLLQGDFDKLVAEVQANHPKELQQFTSLDFEESLIINGIIFVTYIPGGRKKFSFAFLYKYYLGLKAPRSGVRKHNKNFKVNNLN